MVIPGQILQFGTFTGNSVQPRITSVRRVNVVDAYEGEPGGRPTAIVPDIATRGFTLVQGEPTDTIFVTWHYETRNTYAAGGGAAALRTPPRMAVDTPELRTGSQNPNGRFAAVSTPTGVPSGSVTTPVSQVRGTRHGPIVARHRRPHRRQRRRRSHGRRAPVPP